MTGLIEHGNPNHGRLAARRLPGTRQWGVYDQGRGLWMSLDRQHVWRSNQLSAAQALARQTPINQADWLPVGGRR